MGTVFVVVIRVLSQVISLLIIADAALSFILSPYHPVREAMGRILNPIYAPIRRIMPTAGGFDFSPIVLLLIVQVLEYILTGFFSRM
jgi:YggT family protein